MSFHSDDHCGMNKIGCGHINFLIGKDSRGEYTISKESADFILEVMEEAKKT